LTSTSSLFQSLRFRITRCFLLSLVRPFLFFDVLFSSTSDVPCFLILSTIFYFEERPAAPSSTTAAASPHHQARPPLQSADVVNPTPLKARQACCLSCLPPSSSFNLTPRLTKLDPGPAAPSPSQLQPTAREITNYLQL
jgi:hypothetical protein